MSTPFLFGLLIALAIVLLFVGIYRLVPRQDTVDTRLQEYGYSDSIIEFDESTDAGGKLSIVQRLLNGFGFGPWLAMTLAQADVSMTAAEYTLIILASTALGFLVGTVRLTWIGGILLGVLFGSVPLFYLRIAKSRRRRAFTSQLPDVLTLLVGSLRAGYGLNQSFEVLVERVPPPASKEFRRVLSAVNLGIPMQRALTEMARRVGSDDLDLVVMAVNVQYEMGGNLAQVLDTISFTIRERIRILREIQVLTAQQRMTGYLLVAVPIFLAVFLAVFRPGYFDPFFEPGLIRLLPIAGVVLVVIGLILVRRIVDIEV